MIPALPLLAVVLAGSPESRDPGDALAPRPAPLEAGAPSPDLRLREPGDLVAPAHPRRASMLGASAGFLLGDALASGILGIGWALTMRGSGGEGMESGLGMLPFAATAAVLAVTAPPLYATLLSSRGDRPPGSAAALVAGGALHVAALVGAIALVQRERRWEAAGLLLAVDVGVAPWAVSRLLDAARDRAGARDAVEEAHPVPDPAVGQGR